MFQLANWHSLLCLGSSLTLFSLYTYRYKCAHQLCVWYARCKRKCKSLASASNAPRELVLDFCTPTSTTRTTHTTHTVLKKALFPHIKSIHCVPLIVDKAKEKRLNTALKEWSVRYTVDAAPSSTLPIHRINLHAVLASHVEDAALPESIHIKLDKPLIDLLNLKLPVQPATADASYVLTRESEEAVVLHR